MELQKKFELLSLDKHICTFLKSLPRSVLFIVLANLVGYGYMTRELQKLAGGRLVLALEGGYDLPSICDSAETCVKVMVGEDVVPIDEDTLPSPNDQVWPQLSSLSDKINCDFGLSGLLVHSGSLVCLADIRPMYRGLTIVCIFHDSF